MPERPNGVVLKTTVGRPTVGSNPTPSASAPTGARPRVGCPLRPGRIPQDRWVQCANVSAECRREAPKRALRWVLLVTKFELCDVCDGASCFHCKTGLRPAPRLSQRRERVAVE